MKTIPGSSGREPPRLGNQHSAAVPVGLYESASGPFYMALGNDRVLSPAANTEFNARLRALGFEVYDPEVSMFTQAGGGVHCMAQPLRRDPA